MEEVKEILPFIQGGGSVAVAVIAYILFKEWRRMNDRLHALDMKFARLLTALRITNPKLGSVLDHTKDEPSARH